MFRCPLIILDILLHHSHSLLHWLSSPSSNIFWQIYSTTPKFYYWFTTEPSAPPPQMSEKNCSTRPYGCAEGKNAWRRVGTIILIRRQNVGGGLINLSLPPPPEKPIVLKCFTFVHHLKLRCYRGCIIWYLDWIYLVRPVLERISLLFPTESLLLCELKRETMKKD